MRAFTISMALVLLVLCEAITAKASNEKAAPMAFDAMNEQCRPLDMESSSLASYKLQNEVVAMWPKDVLFDVQDSFVASPNTPHADIVFASKTGVANFRVLALSLRDVDNDGIIAFAATTLHTQATLVPERPLLVTMQFLGSIPNNGIAYEDASGHTRTFAVEQSGEDGSLVLTPVNIVP